MFLCMCVVVFVVNDYDCSKSVLLKCYMLLLRCFAYKFSIIILVLNFTKNEIKTVFVFHSIKFYFLKLKHYYYISRFPLKKPILYIVPNQLIKHIVKQSHVIIR